MPQIIRAATPYDIPQLIKLLLLDAAERHAQDSALWSIAHDASTQVEKALTVALTGAQPPVQIWQVADRDGRITGVSHAMLLPVPPIYAGSKGEPGLIMPDTCVAPDAPAGTVDALVKAAEDALQDAGAQVIVSAYVAGEAWRTAFQKRGYDPLTLYLSRAHLEVRGRHPDIRPVSEADIPGIVARSAENRQVLFDIDEFWETHADADARFSAWMTRSLTLADRDMMVIGSQVELDGYIIAQPASRLHFPPAHDIAAVGVIDDYYHRELADPETLGSGNEGAMALLRAAEAAFAARGRTAAFVVCPAGWRSKIETLQAAGYETAMVCSIKR
ncbi:hypothetical protein So717_13480 [Roseobacter cerasinus]|uniref:Uncharacterized protein n=1 Tax=Roseobacter cerasinus TaxID=2602289 RepID=A0A640VRS6_9RHOB|nr:hypothetical protein [Roseobacter cerasinus]GFE49595.1 hypothetical protein So717_13480 [Roseobacter cerasinus]